MLQEIAQAAVTLRVFCAVFFPILQSDLRVTLQKAASYRCLEHFSIFFFILKMTYLMYFWHCLYHRIYSRWAFLINIL